jgi:purine-binding chemotaxis protein CheW
MDVKEVTTETTCTRIPHAPAEVLGYVNIRGHIFLALDLRRLLALRDEGGGSDRRLVIFKPTVGPAFGVIVDEIGDIEAVAAAQIEDLHNGVQQAGERAELIAKVCKLTHELLVVLEPRKFLPVVEKALLVAQ